MKKSIKLSLIVLSSLVGAVILTAGGYIGYILLSYYRIGNTDSGRRKPFGFESSRN